jgi:hypothetical protein
MTLWSMKLRKLIYYNFENSLRKFQYEKWPILFCFVLLCDIKQQEKQTKEQTVKKLQKEKEGLEVKPLA